MTRNLSARLSVAPWHAFSDPPKLDSSASLSSTALRRISVTISTSSFVNLLPLVTISCTFPGTRYTSRRVLSHSRMTRLSASVASILLSTDRASTEQSRCNDSWDNDIVKNRAWGFAGIVISIRPLHLVLLAGGPGKWGQSVSWERSGS